MIIRLEWEYLVGFCILISGFVMFEILFEGGARSGCSRIGLAAWNFVDIYDDYDTIKSGV